MTTNENSPLIENDETAVAVANQGRRRSQSMAAINSVKSKSWVKTFLMSVVAFASGITIVLQTALSVVLADLSGSNAFSNVFKVRFVSALCAGTSSSYSELCAPCDCRSLVAPPC